MQTRKFDELISYFNRKVADMDIDTNYKMELLGIVTALGCAHEKELHNPAIEPERKTGKWIKITTGAMREKYMCSVCGRTIEEDGIERLVPIRYPFCHCGAKMEDTP